MNSVPNWLWFLIAILIILAVLYLLGVRIDINA